MLLGFDISLWKLTDKKTSEVLESLSLKTKAPIQSDLRPP